MCCSVDGAAVWFNALFVHVHYGARLPSQPLSRAASSAGVLGRKAGLVVVAFAGILPHKEK